MSNVRSIEWLPDMPPVPCPGRLHILDQTRLPTEVAFIDTVDVETVWRAIRTLQVRGAPAIGIAAAMGMAAAAQSVAADSSTEILAATERAGDYLATSRPTAVNLFWAIDRMRQVARASSGMPPHLFRTRMVVEAMSIRDEDEAMCRAIGRHGFSLLKSARAVLTHCNAGRLATADFGTALAPLYTAREKGVTIAVYADETRPLLQGARLTAWELTEAGIPVTLICDNMAAQVMKEGRVDAVLVGADRIAANGDTANKIGTYGLAILARAHGIPFYVLAPTSTFDFAAPDGGAIPIETRAAEEVTCGFGRRTAPEGVAVYSPAFDVTPAAWISAIVCEHGVARPDYSKSLRTWCAANRAAPSTSASTPCR
jgi:methylthioribose-1-phosphate isomerase